MLRLLLATTLAASSVLAETAAILPFANLTGTAAKSNGATNAEAGPAEPDLDWIGESIAETLRDSLRSRGVMSLNRQETADAFRQLGLRQRTLLTQASAMKVGEALDAEYVVYGTFEFTPSGTPSGLMTQGSLKISAHVFDRKRLHRSPEFVETGNLDDLAAMEAHLAWRSLLLVAPEAAPPESEFRSLRTNVRLDAQENYIRGLIARDPAQQERFFLQAARLDARFFRPLFELGQIYYDRKEYRRAAEVLQKIPHDDSRYREASFLLGLGLYQSGDSAGAEKAFQIVVDTVPLSEVWNNLGAAQNRRNPAQAVDSFRKALEGDPNDPVYHFNLGYALWKRGDFTAAADRFRAVLDRQPDDQTATLLLGMCLKKQGPRPGDARLEAIERIKTSYPERAYWQLKSMLEPVH
jgi:tetratricopeptide (TPR) repeat protein